MFLVLSTAQFNIDQNIKQTAVINISKTCILWAWRLVNIQFQKYDREFLLGLIIPEAADRYMSRDTWPRFNYQPLFRLQETLLESPRNRP